MHFGSLENGVDVSNLRNNLVEQLWGTRGSRLPLRGVIRLWIAIGSLWNLDRPRQRSPTGRGSRAVSAASVTLPASGLQRRPKTWRSR